MGDNSLSSKEKAIINNYITFEVRNLEKYEREIKNVEEDIIFQGSGDDTGIRSIGTVSDPTSQKALKIMSNSYLLAIQKKVSDIKKVRDSLTPQLRMVWDRVIVRGEKASYVAMDECIDESRIHKRHRQIMTMLRNQFGITNDF